MHIRTANHQYVTIRYSHHELEVLHDIISYGTEKFIQKYRGGDFDFKSKAYKITANKFCVGWNIVPQEIPSILMSDE